MQALVGSKFRRNLFHKMLVRKRLIEVYDRSMFIGGSVPEFDHSIKVEVSGRGGASVVILKFTMMSTTGVCRCKGYKFGY